MCCEIETGSSFRDQCHSSLGDETREVDGFNLVAD